MELGGFAENQDEFDGTKEEFEAFNYCLAEDYLSAMIEEDFESLGEVGTDTIDNVIYWLNYDGEIGKSKEEIIRSIPRGELKTIKGRSLEEAVIENENLYFASVFIDNGNMNPKLYLIEMEKSYQVPYEKSLSLLNIMLSRADSLERYFEFLKSIFDLIEEKYLEKRTQEDKKTFLEKIRPYINGIRISAELNNPDKVKSFMKKMDYSWQKEINRKKEEQ